MIGIRRGPCGRLDTSSKLSLKLTEVVRKKHKEKERKTMINEGFVVWFKCNPSSFITDLLNQVLDDEEEVFALPEEKARL